MQPPLNPDVPDAADALDAQARPGDASAPAAARAALGAARDAALGAALAWLPLVAWLAVDIIEPRIGLDRQVLRAAVDVGGLGWPAWAWLPAVAALLRAALAGARGATPWAAARGAALPVAAAAAIATALRALSLWDVAGTWLPWLPVTWSPLASLALAAVVVVGRPGPARPPSAALVRRGTVLLGLAAAALYVAYTLYICQMVMLHGDEAQYLRVTQSLLRDGDIDLANNLDQEHALEYHILNVGVHEAPSAPPGHVYSVHPVGLSVLMAPAYALGLHAWENPRLGAALLLSLWAAATVVLLFRWLLHLRLPFGISLAVTGLVATTAPLLLFSTQLYPELPAVVIALAVLLRLPARLQGVVGTAEGDGARQPLELAAWTAALGLLPFLHPRYAPLAALLGVGLLWQAQSLPRRRAGLAAILAVVVAVLAALVGHNLAVSGDWMGNFRPGNAWDEEAVATATWWISIPGHWVHGGKGLLLNAPWLGIAALAGAAAWAWRRDRRLATAVALYTVTAVVNGVHPLWTFGFCLPARFLVTALPALALLASAGLQLALRRPALLLVLGGAVAFSWDTVGVSLAIPELAFEAKHLAHTTLAGYYPFLAHGVPNLDTVMDVADAAFWIASGGAVVLLGAPRRWRRPAAAVLVLLALAPAAWGRSAAAAARLPEAISPLVADLHEDGIGAAESVSMSLRDVRARRTGQPTEGGGVRATAADPPGALLSLYLPLQIPGIYRIRGDDVRAVGPHTVLLEHRRLLPAQQPWTRRRAYPVGADPEGRLRIDYILDAVGVGYLDFEYRGVGELQVGGLTMDYLAQRLDLSLEEVARLPADAQATAGTAVRQDLPPGRYVARFQVAGSALNTLFERRPAAVEIAVMPPDETGPATVDRIHAWGASDRRTAYLQANPAAPRADDEALVAPWQAALPVLGARACQLTFRVRRAGPVWFLFDYGGDAGLRLDEVVVYRQHLIGGATP